MNIKTFKRITNTDELEKSKKRLTTKFNLFIRLRDMLIDINNNIFYYCIGCGRRIDVVLFSDRSIYNGKDHHASHYFNSDRFASVEYDEHNVNLSCKQCNTRLHGNKDQYKISLLKKIGEKNLEKLETKRNKTGKLNILEIEELEFFYSERSKSEARRLKIKTK